MFIKYKKHHLARQQMDDLVHYVFFIFYKQTVQLASLLLLEAEKSI
jgi:hypothetical protein